MEVVVVIVVVVIVLLPHMPSIHLVASMRRAAHEVSSREQLTRSAHRSGHPYPPTSRKPGQERGKEKKKELGEL